MGYIHLFTVLSAILLLLLANITNTNAQNPQPIRGRLLTTEEGCGISKVPSTRIVGGAEAKPGAFPWMVLILAYTNGELDFRCGGSLITSRHVLTAAHCLTDPGIVSVRLGAHDKFTTADGEYQDIKVIRTFAHPGYKSVVNGDGTNDVGVLTLAQDVDFNDRIRPVCLPVHEGFKTISLVDQNPIVTGWGRLKYDINQSSNKLMQLQVTVFDNAICELLYRAHLSKTTYNVQSSQFTDAIICAGNVVGGPGFGPGDSGGALVLPFLDNGKFPMFQIGIVAWALTHDKLLTPGVYTRVTHYMDWIQQAIKN